MKNNLAELLDVSINIEDLRTAWDKQVILSKNYTWIGRNYVDLTFFTPYYQKLLLDIENVIGEKPKNYIIQLHDHSLFKYSDKLFTDKFYLGVIHKDEYRQSCINLPVYYDKFEPVNFYDDESVQTRAKEHYDYTGDASLMNVTESGIPDSALVRTLSLGMKPSQIGQYSENHPTIMNVQSWHNVRVLDVSQPRIFIQMSYDIHFDEIVAKDINTRIL